MRKIAVFLGLLLLTAMAAPALATDGITAEDLAGQYSTDFADLRYVPIYVHAGEGWYPLSIRYDDTISPELEPLGGDWYRGLIPRETARIKFIGTGGENETISIDITPGVPIWFVINTGWDVQWSYDPLTDHESSYTVYVKPPRSWEDVRIRGWDNFSLTNAFDVWPGMEMTTAEGYASGVYAYTLPGWVNGLVFSTAGGAVQTEDLFVDGYDKWVEITDYVNEDGTVICEVGYYMPMETEPEPEPTQTEPEPDEEALAEEARRPVLAALIVLSAAAGIITLIAAGIKQKKA